MVPRPLLTSFQWKAYFIKVMHAVVVIFHSWKTGQQSHWLADARDPALLPSPGAQCRARLPPHPRAVGSTFPQTGPVSPCRFRMFKAILPFLGSRLYKTAKWFFWPKLLKQGFLVILADATSCFSEAAPSPSIPTSWAQELLLHSPEDPCSPSPCSSDRGPMPVGFGESGPRTTGVGLRSLGGDSCSAMKGFPEWEGVNCRARSNFINFVGSQERLSR